MWSLLVAATHAPQPWRPKQEPGCSSPELARTQLVQKASWAETEIILGHGLNWTAAASDALPMQDQWHRISGPGLLLVLKTGLDFFHSRMELNHLLWVRHWNPGTRGCSFILAPINLTITPHLSMHGPPKAFLSTLQEPHFHQQSVVLLSFWKGWRRYTQRPIFSLPAIF